MQSLCDRITCARESVVGLMPSFAMPTFVPIDFGGTIREQCEFLKALVECSKIAEVEYAFVKGELGEVLAVKDVVARLKKQIPTVKMESVGTDEEGLSEETAKRHEATQSELLEFAKELDATVLKIDEKVASLGNDLKSFKVVLFGRTKAGKSTVREALTQGAGETIGKGRQSTTKEIRWYDWQNLKVYDTPGILSTNDTARNAQGIGVEEKSAKELLQKADVAIFMFASDNIEEAELDYMKDVLVRGKNVLALLNVKADLTDYRAFVLRHKERSISLDDERIGGQSGHAKRIRAAIGGHPVKIIPIHAQAAFFSRAKGNDDVSAFLAKYADMGVSKSKLYGMSRFGEIRRYLIDTIRSYGRIIRCQQIREYFIGNVRSFAKENAGRIEQSKSGWEQILKKTKKSKEKVERKANAFADSIREKVEMAAKSEIDTYSIAADAIEYDWSKDTIKETWRATLEEHMPKLPGPIVESFIAEVKDEFSDLMRDFDFIRDTYISDDNTAYSLPWSDMFKVGGFVAGCLSFAAVVGWIPGAGWAAAGLGVLAAALGWFAGLFKSKATKIRELQEKLDAGLDSCISSVADTMRERCEREMFPRIFAQYDAMIGLQTKMVNMCGEFKNANDKLLDIAEQNEKQMKLRIAEIEKESQK